MITTTHICDHCKTVVAPERLYLIELTARQVNSIANFPMTPACGPAHWCYDCLHTKVKFFRPKTIQIGEDKRPSPATLESLIRTIIQDELDSRA